MFYHSFYENPNINLFFAYNIKNGKNDKLTVDEMLDARVRLRPIW
jgi:hypothetical protein